MLQWQNWLTAFDCLAAEMGVITVIFPFICGIQWRKTPDVHQCENAAGKLKSHMYRSHWSMTSTLVLIIVSGCTYDLYSHLLLRWSKEMQLVALESVLVFQPDIWLFKPVCVGFFFIHFKVFWTFWMGWSRLISLPVIFWPLKGREADSDLKRERRNTVSCTSLPHSFSDDQSKLRY